jgi:hypothetical protein
MLGIENSSIQKFLLNKNKNYMKNSFFRFFKTNLIANFFAVISIFMLVITSGGFQLIGAYSQDITDPLPIDNSTVVPSVTPPPVEPSETPPIEETKALTLGEEKIISDNQLKVTFAKDTEIKSGDDTKIEEDQLVVKKADLDKIPAKEKENIIEALEIGETDKHLIFDKPVKIEVGVEGIADGENVEVKVRHTGDEEFGTKDLVNEQGNPQSTFAVNENKVTFYTLGASTFILNAAGVTNNTVWLKSESLPTSGSISSWTNTANALNNGTQGTVGAQPQVGSLNFNRTAQFDGTSDYLAGAGGNGFYGDNIFVVVNPTNTVNNTSPNNGVVTGFSGSTADVTGIFFGSHTGRHTNEIVGFNYSDSTQYGSAYTGAGTISGPQVLQARRNGNAQEIYLQGLRVDNTQANTATYASNYTVSSNSLFVVGAGQQTAGNYTRFLNGSVGEVIIYKAGTGTNNAGITSYLASKFGITLDQSVAQNYVDSSNTIFWNGTTNSAYKNNITVIGRDDDTSLNQKQSKSVNSAGLVTVGRGSIAASNAANSNTFANNKSYFSFGDDNGANSWTTTGAPANRQLLTRKFKGQNTNFSETVKLSVSDNGSTNTTKLPAEITSVYLLVDTDGDGNFTTGSPTETALILNGTEWETPSAITIPNGAVFTLATQTPFFPGNVSSNLQLWVKADSGLDCSTNNCDVTTWNLVNNGNIMTQFGTASGTTYKTPTSDPTVSFNFNPYVNMTDGTTNGAGFGLTGMNLGAANRIVCTVHTINSTTNTWRVVNQFGSNDNPDLLYYGTQQGKWDDFASQFNDLVSNNIVQKQPTLSCWSWTPGGKIDMGLNGKFIQGGFNTNTTTGNDFYIGYDTDGANTADMYTAESVVYTDLKSSTGFPKVQSYLASKYGITLDQTTAQNYVDTAGNVYWNGTTNNAYNKNITAIGRDDLTLLNQKQSKSVNTAGLVTVGRGGITIDNAANTNTFSSDKSYFSFGDDNGANSWTTTGAPANRQLLTRKFKGQNTNFSETVKLSVSDNGSTNTTKLPAEITSVYLLVDTDGDGNFTTGSPTETALTLNGTEWETATPITIPNGAIFTFATNIPPVPGGVSSGLLLWNRADLGLSTAGANITGWADQKGTNTFTVIGTPTKVDTAYNFNPTVQFPGGSRFVGNTALNNITELFAVGKIVNGTAGTTTGALIGSTSATVGEKYAFHTEVGVLYASGNNGATFTGTNAFGNNVPFSIMNVDHSETPGANQRIKVNGLNYANNPGGDPAIYNATPTLGSRGNENILNGSQLSEAIIYDTSLAGTNRQKVNTYLATKYGITLDQSTPTSYLATDGATVWNSATNTAYNKNITVIGRDDVEALYQKQSKSINTPGLVTVGRGGIVASNEANTNTFTNDKSYFAFGDDNGALAWSNTGAPSGRQILGRKFKAQNLNYSQSTIVSVPDDSSTATTKLSSELNTVYLLVDTDGDGNFTTGSPTEVAMTLNGTNWETSATIPTGAVFTFATNTPLTVTVEQASGQTDPQAIGTTNTVVNYTATFNQDINTSSFVNGDVTIGGTATGCSVTGITPNPSGQSKIFTIALNCGNSAANHNKTVLVSLAAITVESLSSSSITNSASTSADNTVTLIDNTPPVAPSVAPDMTAGTDTGSSNTDNNTSDTTPDFTGTCTNGETVTLFVDGIARGSQVCSGGTYIITPTTPISNGLHNITTTFTDPAGNQSGPSPILPIVIDTTAPSAPSTPDMTTATDTGASNTDNITSDTTPDFTGTCTNGETITLYVDAVMVNPTAVCTGGTYTISVLSPIANGNHAITTTATDLAGNTSSPSSALNITIDNSIPTTPTSAPDMTAATDTGASNTDNITSNTTPTFTGTCTTGNIVTLYIDGTAITPTQTCTGGVYNITPSTPLTNGNHSVTNTETNPAGTTSSTSPALSITIDNTSPATPTTAPDMTATTDTGSSNTDNTTNDNTPDFTGSCTPGETVTIFIDGVANGSQVCNAGGTYTITASPAISDGPHSVTIKATDPAGNQSAASPALGIVIDTSAPTAPSSAPDMTPGTDSGSSNTDNNTSDTTPTFTGSCTTGDTVTLFVDGTAVAPSVVCTGGNYSITPTSPISDGNHNITTKFTDPAGNQSATSPALAIVIDSTIPTTLGAPDMTASTDTGSSNTDNNTNDTTPDFTGTCTNGDTITLYVDGTPITPTTVCSGGTYSITPTNPISNGTHSITTTATDTAGNTSTPSTPLSITIDTTAPTAPTAPDMTAATDSGSSSTDNITSDTTPDFTGTCTNGETIKVYVDGNAITPTAVCSGGTYTITPSTPLSNGNHSITTTATDPSGNESPQSAALAITIDTTGLTVVVNKAPAQTQTTNVQPIKFEITFSEAINASSLTTSDIVLSTFDNLGTITAINQISPTVFEVVVQGLTIRPVSQNNPVSISLAANAVTDLAGNTSTSSTNGAQPIVDYAVPPPYVIPQITNNPSPTLTGACSPSANLDITVNSIIYATTCTAGGTWSQVVTAPNGTYNVLVTDNTNNVDNSTTQPSLDELVIDTVAPTVVINQKSGQADPTNQASILFTVNIGENGSNINPSTFTTADFTLSGTATGTITNMVQVSPGVYEVTVTPTTSGTVILSMNAGVFTDNAGNLNTASTSTDNTVTFDNILPVTPTVNPLNTNDTTPTITGTCENGTTISVQVGSQTMNTTCAGGTYSVTVPNPLSDNTYNVIVTSTDSAGNQSVDSTSNELVIDTVAPVPPSAPDMTATTDTGSSNTDNNTSDTTPDFTGSCTPGETVTVYVDGIANGSQLCPGSGTYTITPPTPLTNGLHNITTTTTDPAGNQSAPSPILPIVIDTNAPIAPVVTAPAPNANLNDNTPTFVGTGEVGATITVYDGVTPICTAVVDSSGNWSCTPTTPLTDGPHTINVTQTDPAGNVSPTTTLPINIDTVAPLAPVSAPDMTPGTDSGSSNTDNNTSDTTPTFTGTCTNGETVKLYVDGFAIAPSVVCSGGTYSITPTNPIPDGNHNLTTTFTDPSGNESAPSPALSVVIDSTPPNTPNSPTNSSLPNDNTPTFIGSCTPGDTVTIAIDGNAIAPTQVCPPGGTYNITPTTPLTDGSHTVQVQVTDPAGNVSPISPAITISIDTSAPVAPVVSSPAPNANLNDNTPTFVGTGEPNATITIYDGTTPICTATVQLNGSWSCTPSSPLADGPHTINVTQTDPAGNISPTTTLPINIDTVVPNTPVITSPAPSSIINDNTPVVTGTGEPGATITVTDGNGNTLCTVVVPVSGTWSCTITTPLPEGTNTLNVTQTDPSGNTSPTTSVTITIDTIPPIPAVITGPSITNDTTPTITGTGTPGETVTLKDGNGNPIPGCINIVIPTSGNWSCTPTSPLPTGNNTITPETCDSSGNCVNGTPVVINIDTTAPTAPVVNPVTTPNNNNTPTFTGTGEPGATVTVTDGTNTLCTAVVQANGSWTCTPSTPLPDGNYNITATQTDPAGNTSPASTPIVVTIDTTPPLAPIITGPATGTTLTTDLPTFIGTGEPNGTVEVYNEFDELVCTTVADAAGNWTCTPATGQGEGEHKYYAIIKDAAGNVSPQSTPPVVITLDITTDGASTAEENAAPNNGDGNGDGILDSKQQNVASKPNPNLGGAYATLAVDPSSNCPDIRDYYFQAEAQLNSQDNDFDYPIGLFGFKLKCKNPGDSANVTIYLDKIYDTNNWIYRKYDNNSGTYKDMSPAITYGTATVGGNTITTIKFTATDGNEYDEDGIANGEYLDPNGPSVVTNEESPQPESSLAQTGYNLKLVLVVGILATTIGTFGLKKAKFAKHKKTK